MQGEWRLTEIKGKPATDKSSGCTMVLEGQVQTDLFDKLAEQGTPLKKAPFEEQYGKLALKSGKKLLFDGPVKLKRTDKPSEERGEGMATFRVTPHDRLKPQAFGALFGCVDTHLSAEFVETGDPDAPAGDGRPYAENEDDENVVPGSTADYLKKNARQKAGAGA